MAWGPRARRSARTIDPEGVELDLDRLRPDDLGDFSDEQLRALMAKLVPRLEQDRKESQLLYYQPASPYALQIHTSRARKVLAGGGNGSAKSSTVQVEAIACATGVIPYSLRNVGIDWDARFRGPIRVRYYVTSFKTTMWPVMLKMMQWWEWYGVDTAGGQRGHWGWVPRDCLIDGDWKKSWSNDLYTLTVLCRDPHNYDKVLGESTIQFMSYEQDIDTQRSADVHLAVLDEPPPYSVYTEVEARTMRVNGRILMPMTWPDDPAINVDWIFDQLYDRALPGPNKDPNIDYFELPTIANVNLMTEAVEEQRRTWDERMVEVRLMGKPIRFSNRVHPTFTDTDDHYCHECCALTHVDHGRCGRSRKDTRTGVVSICDSPRVTPINHVVEFEHNRGWPVVYVVDPHPRKPHMMIWVSLAPDNTARVVACAEVTGSQDATEVRLACDEIESELGLHVRARLIDPRQASNPNGMDKTRTWLDMFHAAGLLVEQAVSDLDNGISTVNQMLVPDENLRAPKLLVHPRCAPAIHQLKRFMWDDYVATAKAAADKDQKQTPKKKNDDYPAMLRYFANGQYTYTSLVHGYQVVRAINTRRPGWQSARDKRAAGHYNAAATRYGVALRNP